MSIPPPGDLSAVSSPLLLVLALVLEPLLGEARGALARLPHPVRLIGGATAFLETRLNQPRRAPVDRRVRGVLVALTVSGAAAAVGFAISLAAHAVPFGWLVELGVVISLIAQRSLFRHVARVEEALSEQGLDAGRAEVAHIVGRDVRQLDMHGVARAAIESCAENFSDAVVAPTFWYLVLGLPGLLAYKAINTMDSMIGHRSARYLEFGWAAARLDDVANLLPARIAGLLVSLAAVAVPDASAGRGMRTMLRDAAKHRSPNAGWPEAAMAGALGLSLAGPRRYPGLVVDDPWIGNGTPGAGASDVRRALAVFVGACVINAGVVAAVALAGSA